MPLLDARLRVAGNHLRVEGRDKVLIGRLCGREYAVVEEIHVDVCDIGDRNQTQEFLLLGRDTEGLDVLFAHQLPDLAETHLPVDAGPNAEVDVLHLRAHARNETRRLHVPVIQHELRLAIHAARSPRLVLALRIDLLFQPAIAECRADGIRIRILMPDDIDFLSPIMCRHALPPLSSQRRGRPRSKM